MPDGRKLRVAYSRDDYPLPPAGLRPVLAGEWIVVWRRVRVSLTVKAVGFALASFSDYKTGADIRPGNVILGAVCGESNYKTAERAVGVIREYGLIWRYLEGSRKGQKGGFDHYRLTIPDDILVNVPMLTPDWLPPGLPASSHGTRQSRGTCGKT